MNLQQEAQRLDQVRFELKVAFVEKWKDNVTTDVLMGFLKFLDTYGAIRHQEGIIDQIIRQCIQENVDYGHPDSSETNQEEDSD